MREERQAVNVSVLGDSISTFEGYNPPANAVYYYTTRLKANHLDTVHDTWWGQVIDHVGGELLVNESFSGSLVAGQGFPAGCCPERSQGLDAHGVCPDAVLVYFGINDYFNCVPLSQGASAHVPDTTCFDGAYAAMVDNVLAAYPDTQMYCATLMRGHIPDSPTWMFPGWRFPTKNASGVALAEYNDVIRQVAHARPDSVHLIDLAASHLTYETIDGLHPTSAGHATMARLWVDRMENQA